MKKLSIKIVLITLLLFFFSGSIHCVSAQKGFFKGNKSVPIHTNVYKPSLPKLNTIKITPKVELLKDISVKNIIPESKQPVNILPPDPPLPKPVKYPLYLIDTNHRK